MRLGIPFFCALGAALGTAGALYFEPGCIVQSQWEVTLLWPDTYISVWIPPGESFTAFDLVVTLKGHDVRLTRDEISLTSDKVSLKKTREFVDEPSSQSVHQFQQTPGEGWRDYIFSLEDYAITSLADNMTIRLNASRSYEPVLITVTGSNVTVNCFSAVRVWNVTGAPATVPLGGGSEHFLSVFSVHEIRPTLTLGREELSLSRNQKAMDALPAFEEHNLTVTFESSSSEFVTCHVKLGRVIDTHISLPNELRRKLTVKSTGKQFYLLVHQPPSSSSDLLASSRCRVRERIEEKEFLFDSLDFLAVFPRSQMELKVLVQCRERSDLIHISSDKITWTKKQKENQTTEAASIPLAHGITGWERFTLSLKDKLTLKDRQNHSWAPFDIPLSCHPQDVSIVGKHLTRQCSPQTPTWVVKDKKVDIPLYEGSEGVREALTLFSLKHFSPTFSICDASFSLGLRNQKLVTGSEPLEGSAYSLSLSVLPDNTLKVESEGELLVSNSLKATPKSMEILGREGNRFVVVQHLPRRFADETEDVGQADEKEDKCHEQDILTRTLAGSLVITVAVAVVLLILYHMSSRENKRIRNLRREAARRQKSVPSYLEPLPAPSAAGPRQPHAHAALPMPRAPSSSAEHLYENPEEVGAWKSLDVNKPDGGGARQGSFSSGWRE